jgi:hypothetical protein
MRREAIRSGDQASGAARAADRSSGVDDDAGGQELPCDILPVMGWLASDDPPAILSAIDTLESVLTGYAEAGLNIRWLSEFMFDILNRLLECTSTPGPISAPASALLIRFFAIAPPVFMGSSNRQFLSLFLEAIEDRAQFSMSLSLLEKALNNAPEFKLKFLELGGHQYFAETPIDSVPPDTLAVFCGMAAICIRSDFPEPLPRETSVALVRPLLDVMKKSEDSQVLKHAARGCYYFVMNTEYIGYFVMNQFHLPLVAAFPHLDDEGQGYALSAFGFCFSVADLAGEVPLELFLTTLQSERDTVRLDAAIALSNVCRSSAVLLPEIFACGLFDFMLEMLQEEAFEVKSVLFQCIADVMLSANIADLNDFLRPELFAAMQDGRECQSPEIDDSLMLIATALTGATIGDEEVLQFLDLCIDGTYP